MYRKWGKSLFDFLAALTLLIVLFPFLVILTIAVRTLIGSPVFFLQNRPGFKARPFKIIKFRSMTEAYDSECNILPDSLRLTPFGRFLRKTSLDELPELINVLKGEMSLVGPRPLLTSHLDRYTSEQCRRHDVKPGITGWSQVNGRDNTSWEDKLCNDVWYVDNLSISVDLNILIRTIRTVLQLDGNRTAPQPRKTEF